MAWVLFFDGECGLCSRSVRRLVRWDRRGAIHYAPLQGQLADSHGLSKYLEGKSASMVLLEEESGRILIKSDSLIQILRILGGPWRLLLVFGYLPKAFRDWLYSRLAANRRRIFKSPGPQCQLPDHKLSARLRN